MAKIELEAGGFYNIQPIEGENYFDCQFKFGKHIIAAVDGQYFQVRLGTPELDGEWWDSEGFKFKRVAQYRFE